MDSTPRLRSAYPNTPSSSRPTPQRPQPHNASQTSNGRRFGSPRIADIKTLRPQESTSDGPLIPFDTIDAPSQRLYLAGAYILLLLWRLYDFFKLHQDQEESFWLFLKWIAIDCTFLFGLPSLRVPWLEWSSTTMTVLFMFHSVLDAILMFRIPIPLGSALVALVKVLYDREMAISEHSVKPASLLQDPSHILGRYEIHVLPEGSALLNPSKIPLCLEHTRFASVSLPFQINQTKPNSIELTRFDLDTSQIETIRLGSSTLRKMIRNSFRNAAGAQMLEYSVSKPGLYRLGKVVDESNLEVGHPLSETLVVSCPRARIKPAGPNRCRGDLSNIAMEVEGSPPLKIKYRKTANGEDRDITYQSIQPDDFVSPMVRQLGPGPVVSASDNELKWATAAKVHLPLNETLSRGGLWSYSIDQVTDVFGNVVSYNDPQTEGEIAKPKGWQLEDAFMVHERPIISLDGHYTKSPRRVAAGQAVRFPIQFQSHMKSSADTTYLVHYKFTPFDELANDGGHSLSPEHRSVKAKVGQADNVVEPGLYTLTAIESEHCQGDVEEPSSFLLMNPPAPSIDFRTEKVFDKCANRQVGLQVELNMTGTPPFSLAYSSQMRNTQSRTHVATFDGPRGQLELSPDHAGHWSYKLLSLDDHLYHGIDLRKRNLIFEQDVRPSVYAAFTHRTPPRTACIDEPANFEVRLQGDGPWTLEYELVHGKQRTKYQVADIQQPIFTITTERLIKGGDYSLALIGVTDGQGCREALQQDSKLSVRHQRPRAAFAHLDGKRSVRTLESKHVELPLRLVGDGPWTVDYRHTVNDSQGNTLPGPTVSNTLRHANDGLKVQDPGTYELVGVNDAVCPGTVDESGRTFDVQWVDRPQISIPTSERIQQQGDLFTRHEICEGMDDAVDINLIGRPPYEVKYQEYINPDRGSRSVRPPVQLTVPAHAAQVKMDTSHPGLYEYRFIELADYNYDHEPRKHKHVTVQQRVHGRPGAVFTNPGKVHSFCQETDARGAQASEAIPLKLQGQPPFTIDVEIRHQASSMALKPKTITIADIPSLFHALQIPHAALQTGVSNVVIRRVRDGLGCERFYDPPSSIPSNQKALQASGNAAPRVQVSVNEAPSLASAELNRVNYCVGERLGFSMSGTPPFNVHYTFRGATQKASVSGSTFRRIAEKPGNFTINAVSDGASGCKTEVKGIQKVIHDLPSVRVSKGKSARYDIHAGGSVDVIFEFQGVPPFHFTYTRSEMIKQRGASDGSKPGRVLDTRTLRSNEMSKTITESEEGLYEVVAIRDHFCSYARPGYEGTVSGSAPEGAGRVLDAPDEEVERLLEL
ncbi:MAG: hypothetical protein Q9159_002583 [Coniocarpon cinnabarinum]